MSHQSHRSLRSHQSSRSHRSHRGQCSRCSHWSHWSLAHLYFAIPKTEIVATFSAFSFCLGARGAVPIGEISLGGAGFPLTCVTPVYPSEEYVVVSTSKPFILSLSTPLPSSLSLQGKTTEGQTKFPRVSYPALSWP